MKKLIAEAPDKVVVADVDMPEMKPDEVLIRAVRSLISPGSELKRVRMSSSKKPESWPNGDLGYAMAGVVEEVGSEVDAFNPGDRVICMRNHQQFVVANGFLDRPRPALRLPGTLDWDAAPFGVWGMSCMNWTNRANVRIDESVAVVGCGLVGLLMVMWSVLRTPRRIIAVDMVPSRLELARACGATDLVDASDDPVAAVQALTGEGADATLHCVGGTAVKAFETSQRITRRGGRVVLIGHHVESATMLPFQFTNKDLLGASVGYNYDPHLYLEGIRRLDEDQLPVKEIVTHKVPYTDAPDIYDMLIHNPADSAGVLFDWE